jgi:PAS domain S-box-containing protein
MSEQSLDVLIVDADERVQARLETLIESLGRAALSVGSLMQARAALGTIIFPLILFDRALLDSDKGEFLQIVRSLMAGKSRAVMLVVSDSPTAYTDGLQAEWDDCIDKSSSDSEIVAQVSRLLVRSIPPSPPRGNIEAAAVLVVPRAVPDSSESMRLVSLSALDILDTPPEHEYDAIVQAAVHLFRVPLSAIAFVDEHRVWFKAQIGINLPEVTRERSISAYAITQPQPVFCVSRASVDQRFSSHPFVGGELQVRSYAGAVLKRSDGQPIGTLCVMDHQLREFSSMELEALASMAAQVVALLELRVARKASERALGARARAEQRLSQSTALFRQAFDNAPIGMALVSVNGDWLRINSALCEIVGYSEVELLGMTFQRITHPDDLKSDLQHQQAMLAGVSSNYEIKKRYIHKEGQTIWIRLSVSLVRNEEGQPVYFVTYVQKLAPERRESTLND